ncbi:MAG: N-acetylmuramoyl-L-alanine amidase, partial [Bacteroidia bacterium]
GLPAPKPGRTRTTVKHCVIHHTAGSNSDTNYVNTIRNIYLYHTQSNGWDDIGYNYVIAQDGTIFEGRDPLGIDEEDNIQGAHFCSKNGGTMGISLMGDYEIATPSDTMLSSLNKLIAWKLHKENIDPMDSFLHPNSLGEYLHTVTMHRAGCATLCPGENVANKLADIQREVNELVDDCNNFAGIDKTELSSKLYIYPNPAGREIFIKLNDEMKFSTYRIISPSGLEVQSGILSISGRIKLETPTGLHYLLLESSAGDIYREKIVVMNP